MKTKYVEKKISNKKKKKNLKKYGCVYGKFQVIIDDSPTV